MKPVLDIHCECGEVIELCKAQITLESRYTWQTGLEVKQEVTNAADTEEAKITTKSPERYSPTTND